METKCCIVGGGPAGMMLGFLLARAGIDVVVIEKHADFFRDFRGDTVHPSTLQVIGEVGLLDELLKVPHNEVRQLEGLVGRTRLPLADFTHLPTRCKFIVLMPQWDFLNFLATHAKRYGGFHLMMNAEAVGLLEEQGRICGVSVRTPAGDVEVRARLTVAADGRSSALRSLAGLPPRQLGAPMDVLWMRFSREQDDPAETFGRIDRGAIMILLNRDSYWQCGYVIPKGGFDKLRNRGLPMLCSELEQLAPFLKGRTKELASWDDVKLLTVAVDRLDQWYGPGLLCIGDAAHAMSPIGGVGINLAIQDAVAAANILSGPLESDNITEADLRAVQRRRLFPTRVTQAIQVFIQERIVRTVLQEHRAIDAPLPLRLLIVFPVLRRIPAWLIGIGIRPEHVASTAVNREAS